MTDQKEKIRSAAKVLLEEGFSVLPVKQNKKSYGSWKNLQSKAMSVEDVDKKFNGATNFAIICGNVSGHLENLDIDDVECQEPLTAMVKAKHSDILDRLVFTKTPHGYGIVYRCLDEVPGNLKLAMTWDEVDKEGEFVWNDRTSLQSKKVGDKWIVSACRLETRGEAGYFLAAPSKGYEILEGSFLDLKPISREHFQSLIRFIGSAYVSIGGSRICVSLC